MIYKFAVIADIHWGAMNGQLTYRNLEIFLEFIRKKKDLDFVVIAGDYFDYRLQLNSKTALLSVEWFERFVTSCKESGVKKIRIFKGTKEHDNDQLEVFRPSYEDKSGYIRIYNQTISEWLFDDLRVVFCPDENMNLVDYKMKKAGEFFPHPDIGFFHGNFDSILPRIEYDRIQEHNLPTMIYEYDIFSSLIKGPLIAGHWHIGQESDALYYCGSYDRWKFGEEEPKGFIYCEYNTETSKYYIHRVTNPLAKEYNTITVSDEYCSKPEEFAKVSSKVIELLTNNPDSQIRVLYIRSIDNEESLINFYNFQKQYSSEDRVKIDIKDLVKKEAKKEKKKQVAEDATKYNYIFNKDITAIPGIVKQFIHDSKSVDIPEDLISKYISKYLEDN